MSYQTYTTEAIVCGSRANNTSDKGFLLFTREAGMLWASAKSVREERSRQRFALQDFSLIRVSLVRGRSGWRIGSVECERNYFREAGKEAKVQRGTITAIIRLLRQFVHGEVTQQDIFDDTKVALAEAVIEVEGEKLKELFAFRLLYRLGYIQSRDSYSQNLSSSLWWTLPALSTEAKKALKNAETVSHL